MNMRILEYVKIGGPWFLLLITFVIICYQQTQITGLQQNRQKRELTTNWLSKPDDEPTILLPIFAQISKKHIRKVCMEHFHSLKHYRNDYDNKLSPIPSSTPSISTKSRTTERDLKRKCSSSEAVFSQPQLIGERKNGDGCAYIDGIHWHVCEMSHGYTMLSFKGTRQLNTSTTKAVQFLPYPFDGTDNTVFNRTMYYSEHDKLIAYNFKDESTHILNLRTNMDPIYSNSTSRLDVQAEEHGVWILYRRPTEKILTVSRINTKNMRIVANWTLPSIDTSTLCNAFIRCAVLYSVECNGSVKPVYDFYSHTYIQGREIVWEGLKQPIANVQYDPNSKSIAIFANAKIYKVQIIN